MAKKSSNDKTSKQKQKSPLAVPPMVPKMNVPFPVPVSTDEKGSEKKRGKR